MTTIKFLNFTATFFWWHWITMDRSWQLHLEKTLLYSPTGYQVVWDFCAKFYQFWCTVRFRHSAWAFIPINERPHIEKNIGNTSKYTLLRWIYYPCFFSRTGDVRDWLICQAMLTSVKFFLYSPPFCCRMGSYIRWWSLVVSLHDSVHPCSFLYFWDITVDELPSPPQENNLWPPTWSMD